MDFQQDCRFFSGYKPCGKNEVCSSTCAYKKVGSPRILIIHLEALGAVLRGTVLLRAIKRKWPQSHITWITQSSATPLLENNTFIDRLLKNDHNGTLTLSTLAFDYTFCLDKSLVACGLIHATHSSGAVRGFVADAKTGAIVAANKQALELYELGLSNHKKFFVNKKSENQLLVEAVGLDFKQDEYVFEATKEELDFRQTQKQLFRLNGLAVIGLNTGCSPTIAYKKLSVDGWVTLATLIAERFPKAKILLLGGPEDTNRNQLIAARVPFVISTPTETGLRRGVDFVSLCDVVVTGDSLGMHMAIALKKFVVAWFGPTCAHEINFYSRGVSVLTQAPCSPCWKRHCTKDKMCYDLVDWQQILMAIDLGLNRRSEKNLAPPSKKMSEAQL